MLKKAEITKIVACAAFSNIIFVPTYAIASSESEQSITQSSVFNYQEETPLVVKDFTKKTPSELDSSLVKSVENEIKGGVAQDQAAKAKQAEKERIHQEKQLKLKADADAKAQAKAQAQAEKDAKAQAKTQAKAERDAQRQAVYEKRKQDYQLALEAKAKAKAERDAQRQAEQDKLESDRIAAQNARQAEKEAKAKAQAEHDAKVEAERLEAEKARQAEKEEKAKAKAERDAQRQAAYEKRKQDYQLALEAKAQAKAERDAQRQAEQDKLESDRIAAQNARQAEKEAKAKAQAEHDAKIESERLEAEKARQAEKELKAQAKAQAKAVRDAEYKAEQDKLESDRLDAQKARQAEKEEKVKAKAERDAQRQAAYEKRQQDYQLALEAKAKAKAERNAKYKAEQDKLESDRLESQKARQAEKEAKAKAQADNDAKVEAERLEAEKASKLEKEAQAIVKAQEKAELEVRLEAERQEAEELKRAKKEAKDLARAERKEKRKSAFAEKQAKSVGSVKGGNDQPEIVVDSNLSNPVGEAASSSDAVEVVDSETKNLTIKRTIRPLRSDSVALTTGTQPKTPVISVVPEAPSNAVENQEIKKLTPIVVEATKSGTVPEKIVLPSQNNSGESNLAVGLKSYQNVESTPHNLIITQPQTSLQKATSMIGNEFSTGTQMRKEVLGYSATAEERKSFNDRYDYRAGRISKLPLEIGQIKLNPVISLSGDRISMFRTKAEKEKVDEFMAYHASHAKIFSNYVKRVISLNNGQTNGITLDSMMVDEMAYDFASLKVPSTTTSGAADKYIYIISRLNEADQAKFWSWVNAIKMDSKIDVPSWVKLVDVMYSH